jgi:long-chain acyl-CoA synthetase
MEKVWLKSYPKNVPAEIDSNAYESLIEILEQASRQFSQKPAYYNLGVTLTYQQIDHYSRAFSAYLQQVLKLKKGERIALMMPNILQYPIAIFGALRAGLIVVNVNPLYTTPELVYQLKDSGAETIVVLANFADTVEKALASIPLKNIIITELGDLFPPIKAWCMHFYFKYIKKKIPNCRIPQMIRFKQLLAEGKKLSLHPVAIHSHDIAFLQYTGGTTGVAKGAMLTHRNMVANVLQAEAWFNQIMKPGEEIMMTALPLYHIFSLLANCLLITKIGGLSVLITNPRDIPQMISEMCRFKLTIITGVNTLFNTLLNHKKFAAVDFSSLKITLGGGAAVQRIIAEKWQKMTGVPLLEAYGLTETSPCVTINPANLKTYNGTIGLPVSSTMIAILDDAGHEMPLSEEGELAVKGPQVMQGYWENSVETHKVFTPDHWLLTGDIASVDSNGFVRILERKKNMILVSGFNVYPNEIEDVMMNIPGIREAAVIGVPEPTTGEAVKAFIVKSDAKLTEKTILNFCRENLTGYKRPKYIEFRDELPKSAVGKILHRALR